MGYRKFRSTCQLAYLTQDIKNAFQEKKLLAVFFDLSRAFNKFTLREEVPQGGVLSPTLFLVYTNDIMTTITNIFNTLHADNLAIWSALEHTYFFGGEAGQETRLEATD